MKQVVVKGENVYECNTCKRRVRVPKNKYGLDTLQNCIITSGCRGKLSRITLTKDVNATPAFAPEVEGVQDWFQRKVLYDHHQEVPSGTWTIKHSLSNKPIVQTYEYRTPGDLSSLQLIEPISVIVIDGDTVQVKFEKPVSGLAQCITLASENLSNPVASSAAASASSVQITNDFADLVIATLSTDATISLTLSFTTSTTTAQIDANYGSIDTTVSLDTPWAGVRRVVVNGRRYNVRSFNFASTDGSNIFSTGRILNGSPFTVTKLNGQPPQQHDMLILLARAPYMTVDRIFDKYIDCALTNLVDAELYWDSGKAYSKPAAVKQTYPAILVV